jgi:hypothetical protein
VLCVVLFSVCHLVHLFILQLCFNRSYINNNLLAAIGNASLPSSVNYLFELHCILTGFLFFFKKCSLYIILDAYSSRDLSGNRILRFSISVFPAEPSRLTTLYCPLFSLISFIAPLFLAPPCPTLFLSHAHSCSPVDIRHHLQMPLQPLSHTYTHYRDILLSFAFLKISFASLELMLFSTYDLVEICL